MTQPAVILAAAKGEKGGSGGIAAAYSGDATLKTRVKAAPIKGPAMTGALLLYRMRISDDISEDEITALFNTTRHLMCRAGGKDRQDVPVNR